MRRSKLLKASRFGDFLRSTMSWWRSAMISASREARDLKSPMTTHKISLSKSLMRRSIAQFAALRQQDKVYDKDNGRSSSKILLGFELNLPGLPRLSFVRANSNFLRSLPKKVCSFIDAQRPVNNGVARPWPISSVASLNCKIELPNFLLLRDDAKA